MYSQPAVELELLSRIQPDVELAFPLFFVGFRDPNDFDKFAGIAKEIQIASFPIKGCVANWAFAVDAS